VPSLARQNVIHRTAQTQGVKRFDQPAFGTTASREMHVGNAVEQHHHRHMGDACPALIESQVHRYCHCTHRANLQIEHCYVGCALLDGGGDIASVATHGE